MDNNINYQRRCAVSKAWYNERQQVLNSRGSRNWSQKEQKEIIRTGKCHGYEGQHMLSVKAHPEHAGNEKNIQFLTHDEHFKAHQGNWKNDANGKYNLRTGKVESFKDGNPNIRYKRLSDPISDRSKIIANNKYQNSIDTQKTTVKNNDKVKKREPLPVKKTETNPKQNIKEKNRSMFNRKTSADKTALSNSNSGSSGNKQGNPSTKGNGQTR